MRATEVIQKFLSNCNHKNQRVADWYNPGMEVQVMVAPEQYEPVEGKSGVYSGDVLGYEFYNFRIPRNANSNPIDNDHELRYPLREHVDAVGLTGWDWVNRRSLRGGFDYDNITSHALGVGVGDEELKAVLERAMKVPEILVLRSTGGSGYHLYLEFDPANLPETQNHTEHAALMLACLKSISSRVGFDFQASMDVGGGNLWIWHRKMNASNQGLTILKDNVHEDGSRAYTIVPDNWKLYIDVTTNKRSKIRIEGVAEEDQDDLANKAAAQKHVSLEPEHQQIIDELQAKRNYTTVWVPEHHLLQTHTKALKDIYEARIGGENEIRGVFDTLAEGRDPSKPNCFLFPLTGGGFRVCRFGKGAREHALWRSDKGGWTYCYFNQTLDLAGAATAYDGLEDDAAGFTFPCATNAADALRAMGHNLELPEQFENKKIKIKPHKGGKLLVEVERAKTKEDNYDIDGWVTKRGKWIKIFNIDLQSKTESEVDFDEIDKHIRALISTDHTTSGWSIKHITTDAWIFTNKDDSRSKLKSIGYGDLTEGILGEALSHAWTLVHLPFQDEYPGDRKWNLKAPKLRFKPEAFDSEESMHPSWDRIVNHVGTELNKSLRDMTWASRCGIRTGRDYLLHWIALMLREPFSPLPYLFLWSTSQNTGKSIFHEAISLLMQGGIMRADTALTSSGDFNGELAGAVLCVVEEANIAEHGSSVYNKLKDWVLAPNIAIHAKYKQVFMQPNTTHWVQCANDPSHCPVFPGDTRITMINVPQLEMEIPKSILLLKLEEEAPYFMHTLMNTPLPDVEKRTRLPIVNTGSKTQMAENNKTPLELFLDEKCYHCPGYFVSFQDFMNVFEQTLDSKEKEFWSDRKSVV